MLGRVRAPPRSPTSMLLYRPPTPCPHAAAAPVPLAIHLPRGGRLFCPHVDRRHVHPHTRRALETTHRLSATPGFLRGEARVSQVTGSSSSCVLWSNTPPDTSLLLAQKTPARRGCCCLRCHPALSASGKQRFRGRSPTAGTLGSCACPEGERAPSGHVMIRESCRTRTVCWRWEPPRD